MQTGLLHLHNFLRWVILFLLVWSLIRAWQGWQAKKPLQDSDRKLWLFTMITAHITLLVGLYQLALGRYGIFTTTLPQGTDLMKDTFFRFYWIEHPVGMILSIMLITLGYGQAKKKTADAIRFRKAFYFFLFALLVILITIPWPFREIIGRPLVP
ncbi:MAG TPA: hypothetical protein VG842_07505 [Sediminibacterium sp.]|nr:hypothetical protein [Sediminibacterium sp.]